MDHDALTERMQAEGGSREQRAQLPLDAQPLPLRSLAWALCVHPCALSRQALLDALPCPLSDLELRLPSTRCRNCPISVFFWMSISG